jgi:hypothetical protein
MIIGAARIVSSTDPSALAWAGLRRFQNVQFVANIISHLHGASKAHAQNIRKQAAQIRYTLIQAREYFDAAESVTLATKPNLLYYSVMSLAIAEILLKQSGLSSLDKAREEHKHNGLTLRVASTSQNVDLTTASASLRAVPLIRDNGERFGTFELWHRSCREMPLCGLTTTQHPDLGGQSEVFNPLLLSADVRPPLVPANGLSLFDCLQGSPGMLEFLPQYGITPRIVRGKLTASFTAGRSPWRHDLTLVIHPGPQKFIQSFYDNFMVRPDAVNNFNVREFPEGGIIQFFIDEGDVTPGMFSVPNGSTWRKSEIRFWPAQEPLNEFGYLYAALFIAGSYARYYPDKWLWDVEQNSPLALAIEQLVRIAEQRMALLTYSELSRTCFIIDN